MAWALALAAGRSAVLQAACVGASAAAVLRGRPKLPAPSRLSGVRARGAPQAKEVIEETNGFYKKLIAGETEAGKLWLK